MAHIGVIEKRPGLQVIVKLHGPNTDDMKLHQPQLKNVVKALLNERTQENETLRPFNTTCRIIANNIINIYRNNKWVFWVECSLETDLGYLYNEVAERDDLHEQASS